MATNGLLMAVAAVMAVSSLFLADAAHAQQQRQIQSASGAPSLAERQAAWFANKTEYRRRLVRDGQASADRWLDQKAGATRAKPQTRSSAQARKKNCNKVRWVNRATPGFGGGPMTMSRVAVCAD